MYHQTAKETKAMLSACGIMDKNTPTTGVFSIHGCYRLDEEREKGIDLNFEEYCRECPQDSENCDCDYESMGDGTYLIGFAYNEKTEEYDIDEKAEYSAIVNMGANTAQVVKSLWAIRGGLCSPCSPGQVDAESITDDFLAYALPPSVISDIGSDGLGEVSSRIFLLEHLAFQDESTSKHPMIQFANREEYAQNDRDSQNYRVSLDRNFSVIVNAGRYNIGEALDIAIDYATAKGYNGLFLSQDDIDEILAEENGEECLEDYAQGGNEGRYLHDMGCVNVWEV